jgi:drug/metabolite transporter (DMT)-like permease
MEGVLGILTGLVTIVMSLGIVFWAIYWSYQKKRLQYQERQLMIEKGLTPPPVLPEAPKKVSPEDSLRRGLVLLFLGVGFGVAAAVVLTVADQEDLTWVLGVTGAIVGFLGLGYLAYYFLARRGAVEPPDKTGRTR